MAPQWTILHDDLQQRLSSSTIQLVVEDDGHPIAFCSVAHRPLSSASLLFLAVEPLYQRQGIGGELLGRVQTILAKAGCSSCSLGNGAGAEYFWPGVPEPDRSAWSFFAKHGWTESERVCDLIQSLSAYHTPSWVYERTCSYGINVGLATSDSKARVSEFERTSFPAWSRFFDNALHRSEYDEILVASDDSGVVLGSVLLNCGDLLTWKQSLGVGCGSLSVLGVREDQRGRGIGLALAARAMELLQERGCVKCYIHWTGLSSWYGKLGATVWAEYQLSTKPV